MSQGATSQVFYSRKEGAKFDLEYYKSTHMPLVSKNWSKYGLKSWSVIEFSKDSPYSVAGVMEWNSTEAFQNAMKDEPATKEIMEDVKNFSSEAPLLIAGDVVARG